MKACIRLFALPLSLTLFSSASLLAQPSAHYVPGSEGIKGASLPPPGVYLRDYNYFYESSRFNDDEGNKDATVDAKAFLYGNIPRVIWITDTKLLGGYVGTDALLPFLYKDLDVGPIDDNSFGVGDLFAEATLSWHTNHFDAAVGVGVHMPTGDASSPVLAGSGFWTVMLTAGGTFYPDQEKLWSISGLCRYEFNTENRDTDQTPGQAFTLEWGIGRTLRKTIDVGIVGYYQQQTTSDSGSGASSNLDSVAAIGPEIGMFYPDYKLGWTLRYEYKFAAANRLQGQAVVLTLTKVF